MVNDRYAIEKRDFWMSESDFRRFANVSRRRSRCTQSRQAKFHKIRVVKGAQGRQKDLVKGSSNKSKLNEFDCAAK